MQSVVNSESAGTRSRSYYPLLVRSIYSPVQVPVTGTGTGAGMQYFWTTNKEREVCTPSPSFDTRDSTPVRFREHRPWKRTFLLSALGAVGCASIEQCDREQRGPLWNPFPSSGAATLDRGRLHASPCS